MCERVHSHSETLRKTFLSLAVVFILNPEEGLEAGLQKTLDRYASRPREELKKRGKVVSIAGKRLRGLYEDSQVTKDSFRPEKLEGWNSGSGVNTITVKSRSME